MAKPAILQDLWHGGFLSKKVYPFFVETWNYITRRIENLKGDKDENPAQGYITVDNTNPERPIIRFSPSNNWYTKVDSELTDLSLSSIERIGLSGNSHVQLFDFDNLNNQVHPTQLSNYDFIARYTDSNDNTYLKYVTLSALSSSAKISGDANYDDYEDNKSVLVNTTSDGTNRIALYNFAETSTDDYYEFNGHDRIFLYDYWNGLNTYLSAFNEDSWQEGQFLTRKRVSGQNQLRYSPIILRLPRYSLGDSNYSKMYKSISSWVDFDEPQYSLYNIGKESDFKDLTISCDDIRDYYDNGYTGTESKIEDESNFKVLVRRYNQGVYYIDYVNLDSQIIPFVHGDGDEYDNTLKQYSINSVPDYQHQDKTYYQLHKFDDGSYYDEVDVELLSDDYVNLATGNKSGEGSDEDYDFLVRHTNSNGTFLEYRHINLKGDGVGEGGGQVIERIEHIEENINVISNDINDLSSSISSISGDFWKKGGDSSDCYGSSIGDSNLTTRIELDDCKLNGHWTVDKYLTVENIYNDNIYDSTGNLRIQPTNLNIIGNWQCVGDFNATGDIQSNGNVTASNNVIVGNVLKIGNTTINETQLQQLLALLNSSNNVLQQRY